MSGFSVGFVIGKIQQFVESVFVDTVSDLGSAGLALAESIFDKLLFFIKFFLPLLVKGVYSLIFDELVDFARSVGNDTIGFIESYFGNMHSLEFLYYLIGLVIIVFCIKQICKLVGSLL